MLSTTIPNQFPRMAYCLFAIVLIFASCGDAAPEENGADPESTSTLAHRHDQPGETCFICDATKRDEGRLWCTEHSRYEDRCWMCQPQLREEGRLYCEEHALYEDECFLCRPGLQEPADDAQGSRVEQPGETPTGLFCNEHRVLENECGICQPQLTAQLRPGDELKVRFESSLSASKAGIETAPARAIQARPSIQAVCEVTYSGNELARITPLAPGIVRGVRVDVGTDVNKGDVLVEIHSADVASAKSAFIAAIVDLGLKDVALQRERRLTEKKISSEKELQEAEAAHKTAELAVSTTKQRLLNYGFDEDEIAAVEVDRDGSATLLVRAPFSGTLVERTAVTGEAVEPGDNLFTLADLSTMWLSLSIPADQSDLVQKGLSVVAAFAGNGDAETHGELTWVNASIDERSRMLKARALVDNSDRKLRAGMFGNARVLLSTELDAVGVTKDAIQRYESYPYVFVKVEDDLYALRRVDLMERHSGELAAIVSGLRPDEPVVTEGAFTVMSEFLKSRLGAGCVDD